MCTTHFLMREQSDAEMRGFFLNPHGGEISTATMRRRLKINSASPLCINTRRRRAAAQFSRPKTPQESDCPNDRRIPPIFLKRKSFPPQISKPTAQQCAIWARSTLPLKGLTPLTKIGYANTSIPSPVPNKGAKCASHGRGTAPYEDWLRQYFYPPPQSQQKTNLPHERFVNTSGVRSPTPSFPDLAQ